jgi:hypothetical protein
MPHVTAQYLVCVKGLGFSTDTEVGGGVNLPQVANVTVNLAYKQSKKEDTPVALEKVHDCLGLAEQAATSNTERSAARQYAQRTTQYIKVVKQKLSAIEVQQTLNCGATDVNTQMTCQVAIKSTGTVALTITGVEITGSDSSDFIADDTECRAGPLDADQSCSVSVQFQPSASGDRDAILVIHQNLPPPDHGTTVELTGTGIGSSPGSFSSSPSPSMTSTP